MTSRAPPDNAISRSEARLAGILSIAADAIISIDDQHRITLFNHGAETTFGYAAAEVIGKPLDILLPRRFRAAHSGHISAFAASQQAARRMGERREVFGLRKDGSEFQAEASISKLEIEGEVTFTVVLRDVSARVERERALEASEHRLSLALSTGHIGLFEHHHTTGAMYWSPIYREILGVGEDVVADVSRYIAAIPSGERLAIAEAIERAQDPSGDGIFGVEHGIEREGGETRWIAVNSHTFFEDDGDRRRPSRTIGVVRDITERKQAEQRLSLSNEELEAVVAARTAELRAESARLVEAEAALARAQRMEAFGQLAGGIAHDFNNLLTVITGNIELLEMRLQDPKQLTLLRRSYEAAEMGARLTQRLLTFARRRQLEPTLIDLNQQIAGMVELLRRTIGEHITLTTKLSPQLWSVRADASEIENAVLNLAINARDAMPDGGTIVIETGQVMIDDGDIGRQAKLPPGEYVRLSVSDNGMGMGAEVLARAFEPFFTTKQPGKGTGLGLSTIYGFVHQSGGDVTAYSEVGRGTSISIYLPRAADIGDRSTLARSDRALRTARGETVLVVEDRADVREVTCERLRSLGYEVVEAEQGAAAVDVLQRANAGVQLVLSDVVMPGGMSGYDVARWVASNRPHVKVLLASGFPQVPGEVGAAQLPAARMLRKPYTLAELARAVREVLDG